MEWCRGILQSCNRPISQEPIPYPWDTHLHKLTERSSCCVAASGCYRHSSICNGPKVVTFKYPHERLLPSKQVDIKSGAQLIKPQSTFIWCPPFVRNSVVQQAPTKPQFLETYLGEDVVVACHSNGKQTISIAVGVCEGESCLFGGYDRRLGFVVAGHLARAKKISDLCGIHCQIQRDECEQGCAADASMSCYAQVVISVR